MTVIVYCLIRVNEKWKGYKREKLLLKLSGFRYSPDQMRRTDAFVEVTYICPNYAKPM